MAYSLGLDSDDVWERLATAYARVDSLAVLPALARLVDNELTETGAQHYRIATRREAGNEQHSDAGDGDRLTRPPQLHLV